MSTQAMKATMNRWFEALNSGDLARIDQASDDCFTSEFVLHDPGMPFPIRGPEGFKKWMRGMLRLNSAMQFQIEDSFVEGDRLAFRFTCALTSAETGKTRRVFILNICRFVDGKFAEEWQLVSPAEETPAA